MEGSRSIKTSRGARLSCWGGAQLGGSWCNTWGSALCSMYLCLPVDAAPSPVWGMLVHHRLSLYANTRFLAQQVLGVFHATHTFAYGTCYSYNSSGKRAMVPTRQSPAPQRVKQICMFSLHTSMPFLLNSYSIILTESLSLVFNNNFS